MDDDFIYDDEVLPELEIEELLSLEAMLAYQPSFVAFTSKERHILTQQLLGSSSSIKRADCFHRLHTSVLEKAEESYIPNAVFYVPLQRKNFEELENQEDGAAPYDNDIITIKESAPNYAVQEANLNKAYAPFERTHGGMETTCLQDVDARIIIGTGTETKILSTDPSSTSIPIWAAKWATQTFTSTDYLFEKPMNIQLTFPKVDVPSNLSMPLSSWLKDHVRPTLESALSPLSFDAADLHETKRILALRGYYWDSLTPQQFEILKAALGKVATNKGPNEEIIPPPQHPSDMMKVPVVSNAVAFWDAARSVVDRAKAFLDNKDLYDRMEGIYSTYLQSVPALPPSIPIPDPYETAVHIREGTMDVQEALGMLKTWYARWDMDLIMRFMERVRKTAATPDIDMASGYIDEIQAVCEASFQREAGLKFLSSFKDMAEIKEGNDTSNYDGNPATALAMVFEELGDLQIDGEESSEQSVQIDLPVRAMPQGAMSNGAYEVFSHAWEFLHRLQQSIGLPWSPEAYIGADVTSHVIREDRASKINSILRNGELTKDLLTNDLVVALNRLETMEVGEETRVLMERLPGIFKEYNEACEKAVVLMLTKWWLDLATRTSNAGGADLRPKLMQYMEVWSPYGPPMQPDEKVGILFYMAATAGALLYKDAMSLARDMQSTAHNLFEAQVEALKETWETTRSSLTQSIDKASMAKLSIVEAIEAIKQKKKVNILPAYVQALLYLPGVVATKRKVAQRWVQGCCATKLDETFEADIDWKNVWKDLHVIKQGLARKRWSQEPRPLLYRPVKKAQAKNTVVPVTKHKDTNLQEDLPTVLDLSKELWIGKAHLDMLMRRPVEAMDWARSMLHNMFSNLNRTKLAAASKAMDLVASDSNLLLSWISRLASTWVVLPDEYHKRVALLLRPIKALVRQLPNGIDFMHVRAYCFIMATAFPGTITNNALSHPNGFPIQKMSKLRDSQYQTLLDWHRYATLLTSADIQRFISQKREQQKHISLSKLDVMSTEDRQLEVDAKNLKLVKLTNEDDIRNMDDTAFERDGEAEFRALSQDHDEYGDEI